MFNYKNEMQELTVRGSIHTFYNNGLHNANRLTFEQFKTSLDKYTSIFGIDLTKCKLLPLENGTNLYLNNFKNHIYNVDEIIENTICVKRNMFNRNAGIDTSLISGTSKNEVRIKFYSKSADYPKYCTDTLRTEDKLSKIRGLNKKGIVFVSDLYNIKNHIILLEKHLENVSNIVLFDYTIKMPKKSKYLKIINELKNPNYWKKLIKNCKNSKEYNTKYNEKVKLLNSLSKRYGTNLLQNIIQETEKQSLKDLGVCNFSTFKISKTLKNALFVKPKNAPLYIWCTPYPYKVERIGFIQCNTDIKNTSLQSLPYNH
ncbi:hypothetical protein [Tenacibaculum aquimarinum]|uniref:hypothetical protein n=1 Tax=Tenacibaculum aquimarinum TaxID=2910675 RepID=UPI001F0A2F88|nr:hypothetical protein [Tenacibaculum aquimarinum]MCH3881180.1 hypothetical protein [Tenacibaculum aquimarinum]